MSRMTLEDTAQDASGRKLHAALKGYFADPHLRALAHDATFINSPLMNRGYWLRTRAVEHAVAQFVAAPFCQASATAPPPPVPAPAPGGGGGDGLVPDPGLRPLQVLSLGAGYDTLFFKWGAAAVRAARPDGGVAEDDDEDAPPPAPAPVPAPPRRPPPPAFAAQVPAFGGPGVGAFAVPAPPQAAAPGGPHGGGPAAAAPSWGGPLPAAAASAPPLGDGEACHGLNRGVVGGTMAAGGFANVHRFVEIDLPAVCRRKAGVVRRSAALRALARRRSPVDGAAVYRLLGADMADPAALLPALADGRAGAVDADGDDPSADPDTAAGAEGAGGVGGVLDPTLPTLIVAECVLVYMDPGRGTELLRTLLRPPVLDTATPAMYFGYDAVTPGSRFGQQMVRTLADRGVPLRGIHEFPTPQSMADRCLDVGFAEGRGLTMMGLFLTVPHAALRALDAIERIDDYDEWRLVHEHYGVVVAQRPAVEGGGVPRLF